MLPSQAPQPAGRRAQDALQGLRLALASRSLLVSLGAAVLSGVGLWLAHPPADLGPIALVALIPVLWAVRGARARRGAVVGLTFGGVYVGLLMSWLLPITRLGWGVLVAGQAVSYALVLAFAALVWRDEKPVWTALAVASGWVAVEWLRGMWPFEGFAWAAIGTTQHDNPLLLPLASWAGAWGLAFAVVVVNVLALEALHRRRWGSGMALGASAAAVAVLPVAIPLPAADGPRVDVAVVQGNVPRELGTRSRIIVDRVVAENHARLHTTLAGDPPDLAVWPENSLDQDPRRDDSLGRLVREAIRGVGAHTLVGTISLGDDGLLRNENFLYDPRGALVDRYVKNHLVPFGEYVPWRDVLGPRIQALEQVRSDLTPGSDPGRFRIPAGGFASVICFENSFPDLVREFVTPETGFVVVSTNNATFGVSPAPEQHLALSEVRAVETGRWVVHGAISGISAIVDHRGNVLERTALFEPDVLRTSVPRGSARTVFDVVGGWLPWVFVAGALLGFAAPRRAPPRRVDPLPEDPRVAVILPTYQEAETVEVVVEGTLATGPRVDVVVVDDASPDGTADIVRKLDPTERITVVERPGKRGLASAYLDGFALALDRGYDVVVEMDADLSHRPRDLPRLLAGARAHHLTIGSRYVAGGETPGWSLPRRALSRMGNVYARAVLGAPIADATSGFRAYRADALRELLAHGVHADGYAFQVELAYRAWHRGLSVAEVPITFEDRRAGRSKLSRRIVGEALWKVAAWGLRDRLLRRRPPAGGDPSPETLR